MDYWLDVKKREWGRESEREGLFPSVVRIFHSLLSFKFMDFINCVR
jgi:hypothetical protein